MNFKKVLLYMALVFTSPVSFSTEWGAWADVVNVYVKTDASSPYVQLGSNAMPGCYDNSGGYLSGSDVDRAYSTVLSALMGGRKVRVLYDINEGSTGWGMCTIKSLFIM